MIARTYTFATTRGGQPVAVRVELHADGADDAAVAAHRDIAAVLKSIPSLELVRESPVFAKPTFTVSYEPA